MPYPPTLPPADQNDGIDAKTGVHDGIDFNLGHHADKLHNRARQALADIVAELGNDPSGTHASVQARLTAIDTPEAWHVVGAAGEPAFATPWRAYGGGYQAPRFRKVGNALHLDGLAGHDAAANASTMFVLPVGYRPVAHHIPVGLARLDVLSDGSVIARNVSTGSFHTLNSIVWLD